MILVIVALLGTRYSGTTLKICAIPRLVPGLNWIPSRKVRSSLYFYCSFPCLINLFMAAADEVIDPLEDIRAELGRAMTSQASCISRQDTAISNIIDRIGNLTSMMKELQVSLGAPQGPESSGHNATRSIRLDLPRFQGPDPEGWIFQVEEYFQFHGITDDSRIQIAGFHMTKGALS